MEDICSEIFLAIKQDNVELFSKSIGDNYGLCFGRFPILSLLYLYNSRKIIKKYESQLIKQKTYTYLPENIEMYSKFKDVAKRNLRLYVGENKVVSPLEMLLILGKATKVEKLYKDAAKSNTTQENLKMIESIKSSQDIEIGETKIKLPKQAMKKSSKKIVALIACIAIVMIIASIASAFMFVHFGVGTEANPYLVANASQLQKALSQNNSYITLDNDIEIDYFQLETFSGNINGAGHELTVKNVKGSLVRTLYGSIKDLNINMEVDIETNVDIALLTSTNQGVIDNVAMNVSGKIKYTGTATTESVFISVYAIKNALEIKNANATLDLEVIGNGTTDVLFGGIVGHNDRIIEESSISGKVLLDEVNGAGVTYENLGNISDIETTLSLEQTSETPGVTLMQGGIAVLNSGSIHGCISSGTIKTTNMTEYGVYAYVGGICAMNYLRIDECKFNGTVDVDVKLTIIRAGGICALSKYSTPEMEPAIDGCAAVGKIDIAFDDTRTQGYVGGIVGEVSSYTSLEKSFSMMDIKTSESEDIFIICGLCGMWGGDYAFEENAYLKTASTEHGICTYSWITGYRYYDYGEGMFQGYDTEDEIKALEIYW